MNRQHSTIFTPHWLPIGALCTAIWLALGTGAAIQALSLDPVIESEVIREALLRPQNQGGEATSQSPSIATNGAPPEVQALIPALKKLDLSRSSASALAALSQQRKTGDNATPADRLRWACALGQWPVIKELLAPLPEPHNAAIYQIVLQALPGMPPPFTTFDTAAGPVLLFGDASGSPLTADQSSRHDVHDLIGIIQAAPCSITTSNIAPIVQFARVSLTTSNDVEKLIFEAKQGLQGFDSATPAGRENLAMLLAWVGDFDRAAALLPPAPKTVTPEAEALLRAHVQVNMLRGLIDHDTNALNQAWVHLSSMMSLTNTAEECIAIATGLLPIQPDAAQCAKGLCAAHPEIAAAIAERGGALYSSIKRRDEDRLPQLTQGLTLQSLIRNAMARTAGTPEQVSTLCYDWLQEAALAGAYQKRLDRAFDQYGEDAHYYVDDDTVAVPAQLVFELRPVPEALAMLHGSLDRNTRQATTALTMQCADKETDRWDALTQICSRMPQDAGQYCSAYLTTWLAKRNTSSPSFDHDDPMMQRRMRMRRQYSQTTSGRIPLTRARQRKNLDALKALLPPLQSLSTQPLDPDAVVAAFEAVHSNAEIFRLKDIENILGPVEQIERSQLVSLLQTMGGNLQSGWRDMERQQQAATGRGEELLRDEIARGYAVVDALIARGLAREPMSWDEHVLCAALQFQASEFEFDRTGDLEAYTDDRNTALAGYRKACATYQADVTGGLQPEEETIEPYVQWFVALLGATDLSNLTRGARSAPHSLQQVHDAMASLPGAAASRHLALFGDAVVESLGRVPPHARMQFITAALAVVGREHPSVAKAVSVLDDYLELLDEVRFHTRVDGGSNVGNHTPFGLHLTLQHTTQLARESGGFAKYVQQSANPSGGRQQHRGSQKNYAEELQGAITQAIGESFEMLSITFHNQAATPIPLAREDWEATPLAYVLLQAKDPTADRIPSIPLHLDFSDQLNTVVLPVLSPVVPISANGTGDTRPCTDLKLTMVLDTREWREGRLRLDVSATANGLIPPLGDLLDVGLDGFDREFQDDGLVISSLDSDGHSIAVNTERAWQISYYPAPGAAPGEFRFPSLLDQHTKAQVTFKQYQDADLQTLTPETAARGIALRRGSRVWIIPGAIVLVLLLLTPLALLFRRRRKPVATEAITGPSELTPWSVSAFLLRLQRTHSDQLTDTQCSELASQIRELEQTSFSSNPQSSSGLAEIVSQWTRLLSS